MDRSDQAVERIGSILLGDVCEVSVKGGGGGTAVAEQRLNMAQAQALFKQMGGQTVAQGMD